jgi:hypothetical protein
MIIRKSETLEKSSKINRDERGEQKIPLEKNKDILTPEEEIPQSLHTSGFTILIF